MIVPSACQVPPHQRPPLEVARGGAPSTGPIDSSGGQPVSLYDGRPVPIMAVRPARKDVAPRPPRACPRPGRLPAFDRCASIKPRTVVPRLLGLVESRIALWKSADRRCPPSVDTMPSLRDEQSTLTEVTRRDVTFKGLVAFFLNGINRRSGEIWGLGGPDRATEDLVGPVTASFRPVRSGLFFPEAMLHSQDASVERTHQGRHLGRPGADDASSRPVSGGRPGMRRNRRHGIRVPACPRPRRQPHDAGIPAHCVPMRPCG
jgi:hypothetical protein